MAKQLHPIRNCDSHVYGIEDGFYQQRMQKGAQNVFLSVTHFGQN
jgi:hypothetical protein